MKNERVDAIENAIRELAANSGRTLREAAEDMMAVVRSEAARQAEQSEKGLPNETFGSISYDPQADPSHPQYGYYPERG